MVIIECAARRGCHRERAVRVPPEYHAPEQRSPCSPTGRAGVQVVGVYYDYTTDQGNVLMHASIYRQYFDDPFISSIALISPGADLQPVLETLETQTRPAPVSRPRATGRCAAAC